MSVHALFIGLAAFMVLSGLAVVGLMVLIVTGQRRSDESAARPARGEHEK